MSPLYAWERSTWDRHPFRALRNQPRRRHRWYTLYGLRLSLSRSLSLSLLLFCLHPRPRSPPHTYQHTDDDPASRTAPTWTYAHRVAVYREPETKFSATSPPSMLPITRCSRYEIERPRRFSTPAVTLCDASREKRRPRGSEEIVSSRQLCVHSVGVANLSIATPRDAFIRIFRKK